jgi:CBS domain-containing membrane protein
MQVTDSLRQPSENHRPLLVRDLMTSDVFTLFDDDNLELTEDLMKWKNIRHIPVINQEEHLVGLVTKTDFLTVAISKLADISPIEERSLYRQLQVHEIMGRKLITTHADTTAEEAAKILIDKKIGCLPVVDEGRLVGIITERDFVKAFCKWDASLTD